MRLLPSGITQVERSLLGGVIVDKEGLLPIRILKVPNIVLPRGVIDLRWRPTGRWMMVGHAHERLVRHQFVSFGWFQYTPLQPSL